MWWMILGWFMAAFVVAVIFGHSARQDEGAEEHEAATDDAVEAHQHPVLH